MQAGRKLLGKEEITSRAHPPTKCCKFGIYAQEETVACWQQILHQPNQQRKHKTSKRHCILIALSTLWVPIGLRNSSWNRYRNSLLTWSTVLPTWILFNSLELILEIWGNRGRGEEKHYCIQSPRARLGIIALPSSFSQDFSVEKLSLEPRRTPQPQMINQPRCQIWLSSLRLWGFFLFCRFPAVHGNREYTQRKSSNTLSHLSTHLLAELVDMEQNRLLEIACIPLLIALLLVGEWQAEM